MWWLKTHEQRLPRLQHRLQHPRRSERGPRLSPAAARESAGAGALHVRRGPVRLEVHARRRAAHGAGASGATAASCRAIGTRCWPPCEPALEAAAANRKASRPILSPWMTVEEAYLLASYLKSLTRNVTLALGPVRVVGEDDKYPKDVHGRAVRAGEVHDPRREVPRTAAASKSILHHFAASSRADGRRARPSRERRLRRGVSASAAIRRVGSTTSRLRRSRSRTLVVVQDIFASPATQRATRRAPRRLVRRARRHVRESRRPRARDSPGRSAARAKRGRTAAFFGSLPAGGACSTLRALRQEMARDDSALRRACNRASWANRACDSVTPRRWPAHERAAA